MLSSQHKHQLIEIGSELFSDLGKMRVVWSTALFKNGDFPTNADNAIELWEKVVTEIEKDKVKTERFLNAMLSHQRNNQVLNQLIASINETYLENVEGLLKTIIAEKQCVLFLGPNIFKCRDNDHIVPFSRYFSRKLSEEMDPSVYFDKDEAENLSYIVSRFQSQSAAMEEEVGYRAGKIYASGRIFKDHHEALFKLGFPLIVNTNPDMIIPDKFPADCIKARYDQTNSKGTPLTQEELQSGKTIVYNIFGSVENPASILFTERQAVAFTKKAYERNPPIPEQLAEIIGSRYGLFIGFDYEEWHFKILFDLMFDLIDQERKHRNYTLVDPNHKIVEKQWHYFAKNYNMRFINDDLDNLLAVLAQ